MLRFETTASLSNLAAVMAFVEQSCAQLGVEGSHAFAVKLAVEEVCTNIMSYGYAGRDAGPLRVALGVEPPLLRVLIEDRGTAFAPDDAPEPDLVSSAEERRIGGLGMYLVKEMMDEVTYVSAPGTGNVLTMSKFLTTETQHTTDN